MYVGSFDYMDPHLRPPATVWSGVLRHGYVGCLRELYLNGAPIDLVQHAHQQDVGKILMFSFELQEIFQFQIIWYQFDLLQIKLLHFKVQSGNLANRCQLNVMIVHVCMEANVKRDGTDTFVNVSIQVSPEQRVEMVFNDIFE